MIFTILSFTYIIPAQWRQCKKQTVAQCGTNACNTFRAVQCAFTSMTKLRVRKAETSETVEIEEAKIGHFSWNTGWKQIVAWSHNTSKLKISNHNERQTLIQKKLWQIEDEILTLEPTVLYNRCYQVERAEYNICPVLSALLNPQNCAMGNNSKYNFGVHFPAHQRVDIQIILASSMIIRTLGTMTRVFLVYSVSMHSIIIQ